MTFRLQELSVDGAPIRAEEYATKAEAMAAAQVIGARAAASEFSVDWFIGLDIIAPGERRWSAWRMPR